MEHSNTSQKKMDGSKLKFYIVAANFNNDFVEVMIEEAIKFLLKNKVSRNNISIIRVAGALEIPYASKKIIKMAKPDAVIALGVIIKGETSHYDMVCNESFRGVMNVQLETMTPISFGILTCDTVSQVLERIDPKKYNNGKKAALAALQQALI